MTISQEELITLIKKNIIEWAKEEYFMSVDKNITLDQRIEENWITFKEELDSITLERGKNDI